MLGHKNHRTTQRYAHIELGGLAIVESELAEVAFLCWYEQREGKLAE